MTPALALRAVARRRRKKALAARARGVDDFLRQINALNQQMIASIEQAHAIAFGFDIPTAPNPPLH